jgi:hypothetical protein
MYHCRLEEEKNLFYFINVRVNGQNKYICSDAVKNEH